MEVALVRACVESPALLTLEEEAVLRYVLSLAKLYKIRHEGQDIGVGEVVSMFRESVHKRLSPLLLGSRPLSREELAPCVAPLRDQALFTRGVLFERMKSRVPAEIIDHEVRHKSLVLVTGGGGGAAYVYVGVMALLDEHRLIPSLLVGASMGSVLSLFRARQRDLDMSEILNIVRQLSWKKLFRVVSLESRYGVPAAMRLFLRAGIGRYFDAAPETGHAGLRLKDLEIPTIVAVAGIRKGMLPHPLGFYEKLLGMNPLGMLRPTALTRTVTRTLGALAELFTRPEIMAKLHLGADEETRDFDAIDAAGFSCGLPGVIHYDVLRDDSRMHGLIGDLMSDHKVVRFADGGVVDNLPAKAAWRAVHKGRIGTRNAFILGLNGFSPKLSTPFWLPLQRLAETNVAGNRPYAHWVKDFKKTLSPVTVVPGVEEMSNAIQWGKAQFAAELPFVTRMMKPLPPL